MSRPAARLPRVTWLAAGAAGAAGCATLGGPGVLPLVATPPLVAGLLLVAVGLTLRAGVTQGRRAGGRLDTAAVAAVAAGLGAIAVALRLLAGGGAPPPPGLPTQPGPWPARVESVGSPRDGRQVARLVLEVGPELVAVAATLPAYPTVRADDRVLVDGRLRPPPDDDGYGAYLRRTGAAGSLDARTLSITAGSTGWTLQGARDAAGDALEAALPEPEAGLAAGILVGLRERVDRALAADFATAGVSHVVAISGWNIAIVAGLVGALLRNRPRRLVAIAVTVTVVAYVIASGASPSVVRAGVMAGVVLLARESGRAGRAQAALALAAFAMLVADPGLVSDAGFRLSVAATAGLLAWASPLSRWIGGLAGGRVPGWLAESLGITLAAQAATLPDVLVTFGRLSLVAPLVNLAVVPLIPAAMAGGVVALLGGVAAQAGLPGAIATIAGLPAWLLLHVVVWLVRAGASVPFAAVAIPPALVPVAAGLAAALVLLAPAAWRRRRRAAANAAKGAPRLAIASHAARPATRPGPARAPTPSLPSSRAGRGLLVLVAIVVALSTLAFADVAGRSTRLVMLDVGQGDAILVETRRGARMLVDGGPDPERLLVALDARIPPWDRRLDLMVLTHPHEDHVAGLVRVLARYRVGRVFEPGMHGPGPGWQAWDAALADGPPRAALTTGARLRLDELVLDVLWPDPPVPEAPGTTGRAINGASIVLLGEANGRRFLLTGDAEDDIDPALVARGLPRVDVLKVAHHGSATASSAPFLSAVRPALALISVGADNDYGHPAPEALSRLAAVGARVLRTDEVGTIAVELRPDGLRVASERPPRASRPAAVAVTGYDPWRVRAHPPRGGPPAALARSTRLVAPPRVRRGRRGRLAGAGRREPRDALRRGRGGGGRPAPRRGQDAGRPRGRPPPRERLGGLARGPRPG